ncbi:hypothetical protein A0H81_13474 [Grifola frondosa]|uniref:Uncharacterized protein n=1 Tax=Grifola frondosa TaxID=5627 RepID=A0A1C7LUP7_GRIFR|nr:hypothetical protein A0H81_13474 [Grifola frondosa]
MMGPTLLGKRTSKLDRLKRRRTTLKLHRIAQVYGREHRLVRDKYGHDALVRRVSLAGTALQQCFCACPSSSFRPIGGTASRRPSNPVPFSHHLRVFYSMVPVMFPSSVGAMLCVQASA